MLRVLLAVVVGTISGSWVDMSVCEDPFFQYFEICDEVAEMTDIMTRLSESQVDSAAGDRLVDRLAELAQVSPAIDVWELINAGANRIHQVQLKLATDGAAGIRAYLAGLQAEAIGTRAELNRVVAESQVVSDHATRFAELIAMRKSLHAHQGAGRLGAEFTAPLIVLIGELSTVPPERVDASKLKVLQYISDLEVAGITHRELAELLAQAIPKPVIDEAALAASRGQLQLSELRNGHATREARILLARIEALAERVSAHVVDPAVILV